MDISLLVYRNITNFYFFIFYLFFYRNITNFYILLLYLVILLSLFIGSNSFFMESLGFSMYKIMSFANKDKVTVFFPILMPFISFSCLLALARTSSTVLNRSAETEHPCFVPDLRGKAFSFSPLNMMLAVGLSYIEIYSFLLVCFVFSFY